jgi:metal transporter CNNM
MLSDEDVKDLLDKGGRRELVELLIRHKFASTEEKVSFYWTNISGTLFALSLVALGSGFFLGLMTLDAFDLKILLRSSADEDDKRYAAALYPVVSDRHRLLVTLLIVDALAYETLPLFLNKLMPDWVVIIFSTTLVLLFGEIIPSAICMGPQQLRLGYYMVPLIKVIMFVLYPITKPCAWLLDFIVHGPDGEDEMEEEYNRDELSALVKIQFEERQTAINTRTGLKKEMLGTLYEGIYNDDGNETSDENSQSLDLDLTAPMEKQEVDVVVGALQMKTKVAVDVYTPKRHVYAIPDDLILDRAGMTDIYAKGYSRVPVYKNVEGRDDDINRSCIVGFLITRQLMMIDWDHEREVRTLPMVRPDCVSPRRNLVDLLGLLRSGGSLMAFVCARPDLGNKALLAEEPLPVDAGFMGVITLEDILESILQTRIYDESDIRDRDRAVSTLTRWAAEKLQSFARKSVAKRRGSGSLSPSSRHRKITTAKDILLSEKAPLLGKKVAAALLVNPRQVHKRDGNDNNV